MTPRLEVTATEVAAAKLVVKRALARGLPVDPAVQAIAEARPVKDWREEGTRTVERSRRD